MKSALLVALATCLAGLLAFGVVHLLELRAATEPPTPEAFVQAAWEIYRRAPGHRVHVAEQGLACKQCHSTEHGQRFDEPSPEVCSDCHEAESDIEHSQVGLDARGKRSAAAEPASTISDCLTCHGFGPRLSVSPATA